MKRKHKADSTVRRERLALRQLASEAESRGKWTLCFQIEAICEAFAWEYGGDVQKPSTLYRNLIQMPAVRVNCTGAAAVSIPKD